VREGACVSAWMQAGSAASSTHRDDERDEAHEAERDGVAAAESTRGVDHAGSGLGWWVLGWWTGEGCAVERRL
jgi:hypothetical protein